MIECLFVGGKADGKRMKIREITPFIEIPVMEARPVLSELPPEPTITKAIKIHTYRPQKMSDGSVIYAFYREES